MPRTGATALWRARSSRLFHWCFYSTPSGLPAIPDTPSDVIAFWPKAPKYVRLNAAQWAAAANPAECLTTLVDRLFRDGQRAELRCEFNPTLDADQRAVCRGKGQRSLGQIRSVSRHPAGPAGAWIMAQMRIGLCGIAFWVRESVDSRSLVNKPLVFGLSSAQGELGSASAGFSCTGVNRF